MATMITTDCINCGACEPECPNNAISQGETIFVIDPKLCTECVGFHDYEACAAVCPVDCCVTDPNNIETEEALISRARAIHPEMQLGEDFASRFRKGQGKPAPAAAPKQPPAQAASAAENAPSQAVATARLSPAVATEQVDSPVKFLALPAIDSWEISVRCFKCHETYVEPVRNFMIGNVIFCPHCNKSMVVRENLNYHLRSLLRDAYEKWDQEQKHFTKRREEELARFKQRRAKDAQDFEAHQERELERIRQQLDAIGENYDAPGKPARKGTRLGWG